MLKVYAEAPKKEKARFHQTSLRSEIHSKVLERDVVIGVETWFRSEILIAEIISSRAFGATFSSALARRAQELNRVCNDLSCVSLLPLRIFPLASLQPAFDINLAALA